MTRTRVLRKCQSEKVEDIDLTLIDLSIKLCEIANFKSEHAQHHETLYEDQQRHPKVECVGEQGEQCSIAKKTDEDRQEFAYWDLIRDKAIF